MNSQSDCICGNTEAWGYTCPVHKRVNRSVKPKADSQRRDSIAERIRAWAFAQDCIVLEIDSERRRVKIDKRPSEWFAPQWRDWPEELTQG